MARSPLTETYKRVEGMVAYVQQNLNGDEYLLFLDMVAPQPEPEEVAKKTRKKRTTTSPKAQSLSSAIARTPKADAGANGADESPAPNCGICGQPQDHSDHDRTYLSSHDFEPPKSVASAARRSSRGNGTIKARSSSAPNSEIEKANAIGAGS